MTIYDFGVGGFDLEFYVASLSNGEEIIVCSDIGINDDADYPASAECFVVVGKDATSYYFTVRDKFLVSTETYRSPISNLGKVRIIFHDAFCTVYVDDYWIYTFYFSDVYHPEEPSVGMKVASGTKTVTNIRLKELSDWREAIYVDMETSTTNAINTAILQRPVDIYPNYLGQLVYEYDPSRESGAIQIVKKHRSTKSVNPKASSDGIVESTYAGVSMDLDFAKSDGFVTRLYRLPDLDNGFIRAASILQQRGRRAQTMHTVMCRINIKFEIGDIGQVSETLSGTGSSVAENFIIENLTLAISEGRQEMMLSGRDSDA